jgi:hypothetical protein
MEYTVVQLVKSNHADYQAEMTPRFDLLPERYEEYQGAYAALTKFMNGHLLALVARDLDAHRELLESMRAAVAENPWTLAEHNMELNQEALKNVLNFSAAVHAYQEHSEIPAGRNNSPEARKYIEQVFRDAYDECDELFLFVRLRDVLVHNTQDILGISTGQRLDKEINETETQAAYVGPAWVIVHSPTAWEGSMCSARRPRFQSARTPWPSPDRDHPARSQDDRGGLDVSSVLSRFSCGG